MDSCLDLWAYFLLSQQVLMWPPSMRNWSVFMPVLGRYISAVVDNHYVRMKLGQGNRYEKIRYDGAFTWYFRLCLRGLPTMRKILVQVHLHCLEHWWCWRLPVSIMPATLIASSHHSWGFCREWRVSTSHHHHLMKQVQVNEYLTCVRWSFCCCEVSSYSAAVVI